jgi:(S)-ureidoglycine-glyoxylate aminotransferase
MSAQLVGQYDPFMTTTMDEVQALYRDAFATSNDATLVVDGTARAGIEAALVSLISPGDRVVVPRFGRFGHLLVEIAQRCGADVHAIDVEWGQAFDPEMIESAIKEVRPKLLAIVHGDTSTTIAQPLDELGAICREYEVLFYCDATGSLGGNQFLTDDWGVDAVSAGLQKCLGGPSGSAPLTLSPAAAQVVHSRKSIEAGIRDPDSAVRINPVQSNYFDLGQILDYWGPKRLNHHTEAATMLYAARECARILLEEGLSASVARHRLHGNAMLAGVLGLGLSTFGDLSHKMTNVVAVEIPDGVHGDAVRSDMLHDYGIEIGTSFGPLHGRIWRIGTMGHNARRDAVLTTLTALEAVLRRHGVKVPVNGGSEAAIDSYNSAPAVYT